MNESKEVYHMEIGACRNAFKSRIAGMVLRRWFLEKAENVQKIIEMKMVHVTFETAHYRYSFEYQKRKRE